MKERPILLSAPMVLALLAGTKTQTRRILKGDVEDVRRPDWHSDCRLAHKATCQRRVCEQVGDGELACGGWELSADGRATRSPYGQPGDRLWVRETWGYRGTAWWNKYPEAHRHTIEYAADKARVDWIRAAGDRAGIPKQRHDPTLKGDAYHRALDRYWKAWRPSIFLPRWASRLSLEVTGVRVERLQDITEIDAQAEGFTGHHLEAVNWYAGLWERINGVGSWAANPWVWAVEFRRLP